MFKKFLAILILLYLSACSVIGIRSGEQASYSTELQTGKFEIRQYSDYLSAETIVYEDDWDTASSVGFKRLAGYIFGKNKSKQSMAMTSPVFMSPDSVSSQSIEMTSPVFTEQTSDGWKMSFVLPSSITLENAPDPVSDKVKLKEAKGKKYAVIRFSGFLNESNFEKYSEKLDAWIESKNLKRSSEYQLAGYDPPWTLPFLRRNEILVELS